MAGRNLRDHGRGNRAAIRGVPGGVALPLAVGESVAPRPSPGSGQAAAPCLARSAAVSRDNPDAEHGQPDARRDDAVVALYREHYAGLCRLAAMLLGDATAAEEVVQEAFLRTFAGWRRIRQPDRARWYLRAAVVNLCRSRARRRVSEDRGNRQAVTGDPEGPGVFAGPHGDGATVAAATEHVGDAVTVLAAVRALPPRQRAAVVLRYYEDLSEADIAATLGCAPGTVKSQLAKARAALQRSLDDACGVDDG